MKKHMKNNHVTEYVREKHDDAYKVLRNQCIDGTKALGMEIEVYSEAQIQVSVYTSAAELETMLLEPDGDGWGENTISSVKEKYYKFMQKRLSNLAASQRQ